MLLALCWRSTSRPAAAAPDACALQPWRIRTHARSRRAPTNRATPPRPKQAASIPPLQNPLFNQQANLPASQPSQPQSSRRVGECQGVPAQQHSKLAPIPASRPGRPRCPAAVPSTHPSLKMKPPVQHQGWLQDVGSHPLGFRFFCWLAYGDKAWARAGGTLLRRRVSTEAPLQAAAVKPKKTGSSNRQQRPAPAATGVGIDRSQSPLIDRLPASPPLRRQIKSAPLNECRC